MKFDKFLPCNGLVKKLPTISSVGQILDCDFPCFHLVSFKEEANAQVLGVLTTGCLPTFLKKDCTFVIVENNIIIHHVPLGLQEVSQSSTATNPALD